MSQQPPDEPVSVASFADELLHAALADDLAQLEHERLTLEFSNPLVQRFRRRRHRRAESTPLFDPQQKGMF